MTKKKITVCLGIPISEFLSIQIFSDDLFTVLLTINIMILNYEDNKLQLWVVHVAFLRGNKAVKITSRVQIMYYLLVCHFQNSFFYKGKYKKHVISYDALYISFYPDKCQI